jgi:hypothetical protein
MNKLNNPEKGLGVNRREILDYWLVEIEPHLKV